MPPDQTTQQTLIQTLKHPAAYPHPVGEVQCIETHISTVLLAGEFAYKFKKPVSLGFLDFSSLEQRRHYCEEEVRLNTRLAPKVYDGVVAFSGSPEHPVFDGPGLAFEYAVRMHRFDPADTLDHLQEQGRLSLDLMDPIAARLARFHAKIPASTDYGHPLQVLAPMVQNFEHIRHLQPAGLDLAPLDPLEAWTRSRHQALTPLLEQRRRDGFIRECHGDLHLGNIALVDGEPTLFDGIEFNPALRWIDIISEVAFLTMDLIDRGAEAHAHRVLNAWLESTGDYEGMPLLRFYQVYRAMVRAKVAAIRLGQSDLSEAETRAATAACRTYLQLAERFTRPGPTALFINHGFSGSGKTTLSQPLLEATGAIRIRSDVERKRLAGMAATDRGTNSYQQGLYGQDLTRRTYDRLAELSGLLIRAGHPVIVDATFLKANARDHFAELARHLGVPFRILDYRADPDCLRARISRRTATGDDASDADLEVLEMQLQHHDPLEPNEPVIIILADRPSPVDEMRGLLITLPD
ncbi:AAA family ATPase [Ectothiorhodospira lacustris]|uniref:bifunctional aminoglycoside phosphotransferase/ATP-binding protein n=1 Tax=Ectothiorhodospira lacustris TaxID=2899127 RepID=UPI001EE8C273|nr:bifunctional aminoglycoside phosphotransferase/ATP-binding protein [Ectothiorhodospira lacustris]MCG5500004.1 AAA family ATPase [Ectothiorhodospira lacustris]MCG5510048.1 AAA family ATPase [Ectothiorhodospira lacustris]MCG5521794.1 AAA family ATPase [Ectothiorhodospira lacustris]